jgi:hypothetical protein
MQRTLPLVIPLFLTACASKETKDTGSPPLPSFAFALLTDTHVGEGVPDYGTEGWDDGEGALTGGNADTLRGAVRRVNERAGELDLRFALVLGDLTDSGERSDFEAVRAILGELELPWLPLLGNHDVWPFAFPGEDRRLSSAESAVGDAWFLDTFEECFERFSEDLAPVSLASAPTWNPAQGMDASFVNFSFDYEGLHVIALDFVSREPAYEGDPGSGPSGDLHDFEGGTLPFLRETLEGLGAMGGEAPAMDAVVVAHHPVFPMAVMGFTSTESEEVAAVVEQTGSSTRIGAFFGGHLHMDSSGVVGGVPAIALPAAKDGGAVRVVRVSAAGLDWAESL